jgi:hypothetical protein
MSPTNCHINALLASTDSDNQFNQTTVNRLAPVVEKVIQNSGVKVKKALFIYYAAVEEDCDVYLRANMQKLFTNVTVECIAPKPEAGMIDQADCIVVGGGSLTKLAKIMSPFAANIWQKVLSGVPYIGINAGAEFLSSVYIQIPKGMCDEFEFFPLQFVSGYNETTGETGVGNILNNNPGLQYVICMPAFSEGGGIVLEDSTTGLAGNNTDWGGGPPPGTGQELYIYERNSLGTTQEVTWNDTQRNNLPVNYW